MTGFITDGIYKHKIDTFSLSTKALIINLYYINLKLVFFKLLLKLNKIQNKK